MSLNKYNNDIDQKTRDKIDKMVDYAQQQNNAAELIRQQVLIPAITDMNRAAFIVKKFIKEHNRIMYGGTGINMAIKMKSADNALYSDTEFPDYDFYSPNPIGDGIELCNRLEDAGFNYIQIQEAQHPYTYKIHAEYYPKEVADITFVPQELFDKIPTINYQEDISSTNSNRKGSIRVIDPHFMIIDIYRQMWNSITGWLKIEKVVKRKILVEKLYLPFTNEPMRFKNLPSSSEFKKKREFVYTRYLMHQPDIIFTGSMLYNEFIRKSGTPRKSTLSTQSLEGMSENAENHVKHIAKIAKKEFPNEKVVIKEYQPFFQFLPPCYTVHIGKDNILTMYRTNSEWKNGYPYWTSRDKNSASIKYASYYLFMQILYSKYYLFFVRGETGKVNKYKYMIQEVRLARDHWIKDQHNIEEPGPFEELPYLVLGNNIEIPSVKVRRGRVENIKNKKKYVYTYRPADNRLDPVKESAKHQLSKWLGLEKNQYVY